MIPFVAKGTINMIGTVLTYVLGGGSILQAFFDHGERKKAYQNAASPKERRTAWIRWIVFNWVAPILGLAVIICQSFESVATEKRISKQDPYNQPIATITATATIDLRGTNYFKDWLEPTGKPTPFVQLMFGQAEQVKVNRWKVYLHCKSMTRFSPGPDTTRWVLEFVQVPPFDAASFLTDADTARALESWDVVVLWLPFLPSGSEVQGEVQVVVNSGFKRKYLVPQQSAVFVNGNPTVMEGTIPSNVNVRVVSSM